ncbi:MAG: tripartite tricarboxylate transporter TctB family protein [Variibacter sp.]|nr:tripartite tricarboxylate transporter TctB family protein [Variibacter sp.]
MTIRSPDSATTPRPPWLRILARRDVLAGLMFMAVAAVGLWASRDYPIGTAVRMGTGYVPRLMCWILLALGASVALMGLRESDEEGEEPPLRWRPLVLVPASQAIFALTINDFGFVVAGLLMIAIGGLANRESRPLEVVASAAVLVFSVWAIFVWGLGLVIPVWPGG